MKKSMRILISILVSVIYIAVHSFPAAAAENAAAESSGYISYSGTCSDIQDKLSVFSRNGNESYYFDAAKYAADYPDLYNVFGNSKNALWNHYKNYGVYENRIVYGTTDEVNAKLKVFDVAAGITDNHMSDRDKVKAVHDWIINNTVYDYQNYLNDTIPAASYEIQGVMLNGTAVCSGYAKAFDYFMYVLGIEHQYLTGVAYNGEESGGHAWNRVMIDGNWLYIDCTWDDPAGGTKNYLLYDYYLIPYGEMSRDHVLEKAYSL